MTVPVGQWAFTTGEVAPALYGRSDLAKWHSAASTMRNGFAYYAGGFYSRAGTMFVGFSKQTGRSFPPRLIPFQFSINQALVLEFGNFYMRVISDGAFVTEAPITVTGATMAKPVTVSAVNNFANGDWVFLSGIGGMTQLNGETYVIAGRTPGSFQLLDVYGNQIDGTAFSAFTSNGTAARIFTLTTIYAEADLPYLKFTQSADVMSICDVNQQTQTEYQPQDLSRLSDISWTFTPVIPGPTVSAPGEPAVTASTTGITSYQYEVTAVSAADGTESVASPSGGINNAVDVASTAGSITVTWAGVSGASEYYIYKATPAYGGAEVPGGAQFGYAGSSFGGSFVDSNVVPDLTQVPPTHQNPFARGQIVAATVTGGGSGGSFNVTVNSATGSGAVLIAVEDFSTSTLTGIVIQEPGELYQPGDTISITNGATGTITIGPESGTYPSVPFYFQERRSYANSLNNPDTFWMSQPGSFTNFDYRIPTIESDAVTDSPWSVQVNGIQWGIQTPGGLLVMTGLSAWLLVGTGSFATNVAAIGPGNVTTNPQPFSGTSPTVPPIKINYDVIYVTSLGSLYYDLPYQLYALSEPIDLTEMSSHLFVGYSIKEHAWSEQPYKVIWSVRSDGALLSLTYLKAQQVSGWARHDTQGFFESVCSVTEPPVDAVYFATQRFPNGNNSYMIERMDNRIWPARENCWCVDAGLELTQPTPNATLTASSATGLGSLTGVTGLVGGSLYSAATTATVVDRGTGNGPGPGTGATPTLTIVGGVITAVTFGVGNQGAGYLWPELVFSDPTNAGSGASASPILNNTMTFTASAAVFSAPNVGSVIRMGGGIATITGFTDTEHVTANILVPITTLIPNSGGVPAQAGAGNWTMTAPVTTISGLNHLIGMKVTGLADGNPITPQTVSAQGTITLSTPASAVIAGLAFQSQLQSIYLDAGQPTVQGQRKKIAAVTARIQASGDFVAGANQPDGGAQNPPVLSLAWKNLAAAGVDGWPSFPLSPYNAICPPLRTGDIRIPLQGGFQTPGQICIEQDLPLPINILDFVGDVLPGDTAQVDEPQKQRGH